MADENTIELPSVVQRFREAGDALTALRERLRALELAEQSQSRSAQSIDAASDTLTSTANEMATLADVVRQACSLTEQAMESTRRFLESTDLTALRSSLNEVEQAVATRHDATDAQLRELNDAVAGGTRSTELVVTLVNALTVKVDNEIAAAKQEAATAQAAHRALEAKIALIPEKTRRKLGL